VAERVEAERVEAERVEALRSLVAEAVADLEGHPRSEPLARALRLTYLKPTPTQAIAAERLGLPFSTFRRHLTRAVAHVEEALWAREVG
jgi:DNA-directed RNA polymerase specialized sigma24 family protein